MTIALTDMTADMDITAGMAIAPGGRLGNAARRLVRRLWQRCADAISGAFVRTERSAPATAKQPDLPGGNRTIRLAPAPMTAAEQWTRATSALTAAATSAHNMRELHAAADKQLCSVDYALEQLIDDLSAIMTVPRAPRASVHALRPMGPVEFSTRTASATSAMAA